MLRNFDTVDGAPRSTQCVIDTRWGFVQCEIHEVTLGYGRSGENCRAGPEHCRRASRSVLAGSGGVTKPLAREGEALVGHIGI